MIEPPWWIGSRNLTDSDKRLFGVACSIKQHQPPPLLSPHLSFPPSPPLSSFLPLLVYSVAMATPSRSRHVVEKPVRVPLSDHLIRVASTGGLFHTASSFNLPLIKSAHRCAPRLRSAVSPFRRQVLSLCNLSDLVFWRGPLWTAEKKNINTSPVSNLHVCEESVVSSVIWVEDGTQLPVWSHAEGMGVCGGFSTWMRVVVG